MSRLRHASPAVRRDPDLDHGPDLTGPAATAVPAQHRAVPAPIAVPLDPVQGPEVIVVALTPTAVLLDRDPGQYRPVVPERHPGHRQYLEEPDRLVFWIADGSPDHADRPVVVPAVVAPVADRVDPIDPPGDGDADRSFDLTRAGPISFDAHDSVVLIKTMSVT